MQEQQELSCFTSTRKVAVNNAGSNKRNKDIKGKKYSQPKSPTKLIGQRLDALQITISETADKLINVIRLFNDPNIPEPTLSFEEGSVVFKEDSSQGEATAVASELISPEKAEIEGTMTPGRSLALKKFVSHQAPSLGSSAPSIEFKKQLSTPAKFGEDVYSIDLAIMYSSPLVEMIEKKFLSYPVLLKNDQFNFADEIFEFTRILKRSKKALSVYVGCVSLDQFVKNTKKTPKILHLACHTGWNQEQKKFCLYFENTKLELLQVTPQNLEKLLPTDLSKVNLVLLSAPYSEVFAKTFLKLKARCVIVINNQHRIAEENISKWFCREFYQQLLEEKSIQEAFDISIKNFNKKRKISTHVCCCFHSHAKNCKWSQILLNTGVESAHAAHQSFCSCQFKNVCIHDMDCEEAQSLMNLYDYKAAIIESEMEAGKDHSWFQTDHRMCCCCPQLNHDINMLIKIYFHHNHRGYGSEKPFLGYRAGELRYSNNQIFKKPFFKDVISIGMETVLHHIYNSIVFNRKRVIMLFGDKGSGKSLLARQVSNSLLERNVVTEVKYVNMEKISNLNVFISRISNKTGYLIQKQFLNNISLEHNVFVVLENINLVLETNSSEFFKMLNSIIEKTRLKILIICTFKEELLYHFDKMTSESVHIVEEVVHLPSISCMKAARMLQILTNGTIIKKGFSFLDLQAHSIFKLSENERLLPKRISDIAFQYRKGKTLEEIEELMNQEMDTSSMDSHDDSMQQKIKLIK